MFMKLFAILTLSVTFFCLQTTSVNAQEAPSPEKTALLKELLVVMEAHKNAEAIMDSVVSRLEQDRISLVTKIIDSHEALSINERKELKKKLIEGSGNSQRVSELFRQRVNFSKIVDDVTLEIYDKYYSTDEIRDIVTFYKTPTGKKTVQLMPQLFSESMAKTSERLIPLLTPIVKEIMEEEMKRTEKMIPGKASPRRRQ